jgi:tetratricopeptide (TPR) repeat protein
MGGGGLFGPGVGRARATRSLRRCKEEMDMALRDQILELIAEGGAAEKETIAALAAEEWLRGGRADAWAPKDVLLHIAAWNREMANRLGGGEALNAPRTAAEIDEANRKVFEAHAGESWETVVPALEAVHADLAALVRGLDEEELRSASRFAWQQDQPLWRSIAGSVFVHPAMHLAQILLDAGRREAANVLQERAARRLAQLDDNPHWLGTVRYNLACHYALAEERERSLALLSEALSLHPGLREWSREDMDLVSLRGDPAFERVTVESSEGGAPPAR